MCFFKQITSSANPTGCIKWKWPFCPPSKYPKDAPGRLDAWMTENCKRTCNLCDQKNVDETAEKSGDETTEKGFTEISKNYGFDEIQKIEYSSIQVIKYLIIFRAQRRLE